MTRKPRHWLAALLLASACSASPSWTKPNATKDELGDAMFSCEQESERGVYPMHNQFTVDLERDLFMKCMEAKGWRRTT